VEVIIQPDDAAAAFLVARIIAKELRANPHLVMGLATGRTMEAVYEELVLMHREDRLDFSLCHTFNLDETSIRATPICRMGPRRIWMRNVGSMRR